MQELIIDDPTPIYSSISWLNEKFEYIPNEWITIPFNTISATTSDISIVPRGIIAIKRRGIYLFTCCFTPYDQTTWFTLSLSKNSGVMTQLMATNASPHATDGHTNSTPFTYTLHITKEDLMVNSTLACNVEINVMAGKSSILKWDSPTNWVHITRLN